MTNAQHTPGPWELSEGDTSVWAMSPLNAHVRIADIKQHSPMNGINNKANARLIAAASELLDGLDDIANIAADIDWQQADPKYYRMMLNAAVNRSRALITKAKGE